MKWQERMSKMIMRELSAEELTGLYEAYMREDFPQDELKPLQVLLDKQAEGISRVYGWFAQGQDETSRERLSGLRAYAILMQPEYREPYGQDLYVLLDYYAVCSGYRDQGIGSVCLRELMHHVDCKGVLYEVEDPDSSETEEERTIREKRIRFYERIGCRWIQGIRANVFGVEFRLLLWNREGQTIPPQEMKDAMTRVYRQMLPEEIFRQQIHLSLSE